MTFRHHFRKVGRLVLVCSLVLVSRGASGRSTPPDASAGEQHDSLDDLLSRAERVIQKAGRLRGLKLRRKIAMDAITREEILQHIERKIVKEYSEAQIASEAALLKALGLLPAQLDYRKTVLELLKDQVAGFYDPSDQKLHLARWIPLGLQEPALAHEICHALQDQHFGLKQYLKPSPENSDRQLAQAALIEGDCTAAMIEYLLQDQGLDLSSMPDTIAKLAREMLLGASSPTLAAAPAYLRESLAFPYIHGLAFLHELRSRQPWQRINGMYRHPPQSTEQVLHSEKFWRGERPIIVASQPLPALDGYHRVKQDVLGEFGLGVLLAQAGNEAAARRAAEGWGGDLVIGFQRDSSSPVLTVQLTTWDSDEDALEFANAMRYVLTKRGLDSAQTSSQDSGLWIYQEKETKAPDALQCSVQLRGQHVLVLGAVAAELRAKLQTQVWERWRIGGKRIAAH